MNKPLVPLHQLDEWGAYATAVEQAKIDTNQLRIISAAELRVDLTAQRHSHDMQKAAEALLTARQFEEQRQMLFDGEITNTTEGRPAWHTMLREPQPLIDVADERNRVLEFVRQADSERIWRNIVHIGIGGSDWGVRLIANAFGYAGTWRNIRYVSNIDGHAIEAGLAGLDPRDTLIVIATKSFTTSETMENAKRALEWLKASQVQNPYDHIIAVTANPEAAKSWGVSEHRIFKFWDWVGGRFSIWSAVGVAAGLTVGSSVLAGLQSGAHAMDEHFLKAPLAENIPVQLAMTSIANRSVLGYGSRNLAVYDSRLANLIPYLQQLEMESLGKSVDKQGEPIEVPTGAVIWGMPGTDAQHTFFQWLHQGTDGAPVDFIVCQHEDHRWENHHRQLLAHCLAQREALLKGKTEEEAYKENIDKGMSEETARELAKHRKQPGGRASNLIVLPRLTPFALGALLAMYEHKVFVQGVVWGLNPFDQWGVELGKVLAKGIERELAAQEQFISEHDLSTQYWINIFRK
ncbi:glucose-6-phosphate isomerase [Pelistega europaea]|uniref:Glucose-6-phosphate isomerase n=1 Tax=Pelistega europaea TaxID=106147 RepID=A0A7Y4P4A9_9BURK|nr:glucose-6-phosphate isomerase [Pelistega europaea]NOL49902.1 glucose-6-phosphate isomerase [Pelistega europaea]